MKTLLVTSPLPNLKDSIYLHLLHGKRKNMFTGEHKVSWESKLAAFTADELCANFLDSMNVQPLGDCANNLLLYSQYFQALHSRPKCAYWISIMKLLCRSGE